ncbi:MAG: 1-(5-phosphoribosyl)-5-[(5-phosphoribosylamino)methylideneamino]imidazole-4-carboxamide isomerase [Actinomycetota bacterium]|nr:1-(5-phosphoribosyl)-5-[(5-phosphoribosylamino)methylideneamino]imidazole-4-carboxamide isomerase [Actinomycetota bacterium]
MSFTVYPAVDISQGRCVRLLQGRFGSETVYSEDPAEVAASFCRAGAAWLHVVDLDGARTGEPQNRELLVEVVRSAKCPVQASGGVRSAADVDELLSAGAARVVLGTVAIEDPDTLAALCRDQGERIAVSLDARGGLLQSHGWTVGTGTSVLEVVAEVSELGVWGFVYTNVDRDGTMAGPDLVGLQAVLDAGALPVIASGGIGSLEEVRAVAERGAAGAIVGRALYEGTFTIPEAMAAGASA